MPQPLPRTDSRDFEVDQLVPTPQDSTAGSPVAVWIRFWIKSERGFEPVRVSAESDSIIVQMISDLVVAGGGRLEKEPPSVLVARFNTPIRAVTVAKRIHRCVSAFVAEADESAAVGIAICAAREGVQDFTAVRSLLETALPGRVVLPEDIWRQLQSVPGLRLRTPSPAGLGEADRQVREVVWTPLPEYKETQPSARFADSQTSQETESARQNRLAIADGTAETATKISPPAADDEIFGLEDSEPGSGVSSPPLIRAGLVAAGILVLVFSTLLVHSYWHNSKRTAPGAQPQSPTAPQAKAPGSPTETGTSPGTSKPSAAKPPETHQASPTPTAGAGADSPAAKSPSPQSQQTQPQSTNKQGQASDVSEQSPHSCSGFFPYQIGNLLAQADEEDGAGNYEEAIHEYQVVLCLDPHNVKARAGLDRAKRAIDLNRDE